MDKITPLPHAVSYEEGELFILDQRKLPFLEEINRQTSVEDVWESIKALKVRGAPAIGIAAAYGLIVGLRNCFAENIEDLKILVKKRGEYLKTARPTAVNLGAAIDRMCKKCNSYTGESSTELFRALEREADAIYREDEDMCAQIGLNGKSLLNDGSRILTHCNAGALAASRWGTALAPIYAAHLDGVKLKVYADETRPLLQGARLTAWELQRSGVDVTLICDGMGAYLMSKGLIDLIIVGCDRVAANGDTANKIGTLSLAVAANYFNVPFYVACPSPTFDKAALSGDDIVIEEREGEEITHFNGIKVAAPDVKVFNPAFDITPFNLITGFITEKGVIRQPFDESLLQLSE